MHPLIRIVPAMFFLCLLTGHLFAGTASPKPVRLTKFYLKNIEKLDSILTSVAMGISEEKESAQTAKKTSLVSGRICSCQILNLESSNFDHRYVVLLAEKTNDGSGSAYTAARNRIQKEKKTLKKMFYDRVKLVSEMQGAGSCKSMFYQLRAADKNLQLYEILNADIN